jgi:HlyD family secretion protein
MSKKAKKRVTFLVFSAVTVAGALIAWWQLGAEAKPAPAHETEEARTGSMVIKVSATGAVEPEYVVEIKSKASGEVAKVLVEEGQKVEKGELLIEIDPAVETRQVKKAKAEVLMSQAGYVATRHKQRYAAHRLEKELALLQKGLVSEETVEGLRKEKSVLDADLSLKGAQVRRAKEALSEAKDRLGETKITAPIDGTVLERLVQPGQIAASGTKSVSGGTTLLEIADLSRLFVRVEVDEVDVAKIRAGMKVRITADAYPGKVYGGRMLRVSPQGKEENNVTVFEVVLQADERGSRALKPMMTADVDIIIAERKDVVMIPQKALVRQRSRRREKRAENAKEGDERLPKKQGRRARIFLANGEPRSIRVGLSDGRDVEVLSGLEAGEKVRIPRPKKSVGRSRSRHRQGGMRAMRRAMRGGRGRRGGRR